MVSPVQFSELVGLGRSDAAKRFSGNVLDRGNFVVDNEDLLVIRHGGNGVSILVALDDDIGEDCGLD